LTNSLTDKELFDLVLLADDELYGDGFNPKERHLRTPQIVMEKLGITGYVASGPHAHPLFTRIRKLQEHLYRKKDIRIGGVHGGIFMFRGIVAKVEVPLIFGQIDIDPFELSDLSESQKGWIKSRDNDLNAYLETFVDLLDFSASIVTLHGFKRPPEKSHTYLTLAKFQMQAAAATLVEAFDTRGAVQSAILGSELVLKAALMGAGTADDQLKTIGHRIPKAAGLVADKYKNFDRNKVLARAEVFPKYVDNRYSAEQPSLQRTGEIVMASQFICGEVARVLTEGSVAKGISIKSGTDKIN